MCGNYCNSYWQLTIDILKVVPKWCVRSKNSCIWKVYGDFEASNIGNIGKNKLHWRPKVWKFVKIRAQHKSTSLGKLFGNQCRKLVLQNSNTIRFGWFGLFQISAWSEWSKPSECDSGCLFGENGRLRDGSSGLKTFRRSCHDYRWSRKKCSGSDKKYETCFAKQVNFGLKSFSHKMIGLHRIFLFNIYSVLMCRAWAS